MKKCATACAIRVITFLFLVSILGCQPQSEPAKPTPIPVHPAPTTPAPSVSPPISTTTSTADIPIPETNQLLAMILTQLAKGRNDYFIVAPKTNAMEIFRGEPSKARIIQTLSTPGYNATDLVNRFFELNREDVPLTIPSSPENGYSIDYEDKYSKYPREDLKAFWEQWHLDNPKAVGYLRISIPATDTKTGYILIYIGITSGELAGIGEIIVYRYWDGKLFQVHTIGLWIS